MNKAIIILMGFALTVSASQVSARNDFYAGLKGGQVKTEIPDGTGGTIDDSGTGVGFLVGRDMGVIDMEMEFMTADVDSDALSIEEIEIDTVAVYAAFRSDGDMYFKGKAGYLSESATVKTIYGDGSADDTGLSYGLGGGFRSGSIFIEAEYTVIEADADYISLGVNYFF